MRLWVLNEGAGRAEFYGMTGQGAVSSASIYGGGSGNVARVQPMGLGNGGSSLIDTFPGARAVTIQMTQINGSNTGTWGLPPFGATGAYQVW